MASTVQARRAATPSRAVNHSAIPQRTKHSPVLNTMGSRPKPTVTISRDSKIQPPAPIAPTATMATQVRARSRTANPAFRHPTDFAGMVRHYYSK
jgi:hypothetical protein